MKDEETAKIAHLVMARAGIKSPTYKVETMCLNCCTNIKLEIPKGIRVKGQECPNCGCKLGMEDEK